MSFERMREVMLGLMEERPTPVPDYVHPVAAEYEDGLRMPIGPLMTTLIQSAMGSLEILGCLLTPRSDAIRVRGMTPSNVIPFAETATLDHFAFLATDDASLSSDERPVCAVRKGWPTTRVVARDLAAFLSLLAVAGESAIARDAPDERYLRMREEKLSDPFDGEAFQAATERLCRLPGVALPALPSAILRASPDLLFDLDESPIVLTLPHARELWANGRTREARRALAGVVEKWLALGDLVHAANWAELRRAIEEIAPHVPEEQRGALAARGAWPNGF